MYLWKDIKVRHKLYANRVLAMQVFSLLPPSDFRINHKAMTCKAVVELEVQKDYVYQKMENPEVYLSLHIHGQLVYNKGDSGIQCEGR